MIILDKILKKLKQEGRQVLIFSQFVSLLDLIEQYCELRDYRACRIDGRTQLMDRGEQMDAF
jgi:SWI/SNF-related matrix-associated actin-dependent regulator of chromatin subfamily A member 5